MGVWELVSVRRSPQMKSLNSQRQLMVVSAVTNKLGGSLAVSPLGFKNKEMGMINEFAFHRAKRMEFPLHYFVFRQTASHLPHEANVEQIFSLGGRLSDPNMNPAYLATLVFIDSIEKMYMPPIKDIWQRYLRKFTKNGSSWRMRSGSKKQKSM
eukprot:3238358-Prymnesium_polylepis.1